MFNEVTVQDHTGLIGALATDVVIQDSDLQIDTDIFDSVQFRVEILQITDGDLHIETALSPEGPWTSLTSYNSAGQNTIEMECDPNATYQLERYLRWRFAANAATWDICFMIAAVFEKLDGEEAAYVPQPESGRTPVSPRRTR